LHASIWKFRGDPDDLLAAYDAVMGEIPASNMRLHLCLRTPDGMIMVDTCPSREAFDAFAEGDFFRALRAKHGLPDPEQVEDFPVHTAYIEGAVIDH
jgi:hypothetical protein